MKRLIELGPELRCDLDRLITTRLLIQANSGGGKSWALRRLLEQTHGHVQQLVIDPEGEFATLREKYDYVLAARTGGDTVADPRTAALLATRLLELEASAVLDLYELKKDERKAFVRNFIEAVVEAPRRLWHPVLIPVDEIHNYCPEKDQAESSSAIIDLATRGRKRGYCLVACTQRLAKFDKDAAAELNNKLIGRTVLDDDMKRAGDELGFRTQEQRLSLRELGATSATEGEFFAFGPAFNARGIIRGRTGPVLTTHPKAGERLRAPSPPPTAKVKALLPKLADLPAEAAERVATMEGLRRQVTELRRENTTLKHAQPAPPPAPKTEVRRVEVSVVAPKLVQRLERALTRLDQFKDRVSSGVDVMIKMGADLRGQVQEVGAAVAPVRDGLAKLRNGGDPKETRISYDHPRVVPVPRPGALVEGMSKNFRKDMTDSFPEDAPRPKAGARRMLEALARRHPVATTWRQAAQLAALGQSGTFDAYKGDLRRGGYVLEDRGFVVLTEKGWNLLGREPGSVSAQTTEEMLTLYAGILKAGARRMVDVLMAAHPERLTREDLSTRAGIAQSGTFDAYLGDLVRAGLVEKLADRTVRASELLMNPAGAT